MAKAQRAPRNATKTTADAVGARSAIQRGRSGQKIGYVRVSTADQNDARQLDGMSFDRLFTDHASGKDVERPQLKAMLDYARDGDQIFVHSMDRLSRSLRDLQSLVEQLTSDGIAITFQKENLCFEPQGMADDPHRGIYATLMMQLLGAVAQFERALINERQREGIEIAKKQKKYKGRKPSLDAARIAELRAQIGNGMSKATAAKHFGISRATVYVYLKN